MTDWKSEVTRRLAIYALPAIEQTRIVEELALHLDDRVAALRREGHADEDAWQQALDEISDDELTQGGWAALPPGLAPEPPVRGTGAPWLDGGLRDLRHAVRSLLRQPGFTVTAVLALAIGIGGTTAIFAAVDAVLLRPMPFPHADRLVVPVSQHPSRDITRANVTFADAEDWRHEPGLFADVAIWRPGAGDLTGSGDPERVTTGTVSEEFFRLIDVPPLEGRTLRPADYQPAAPAVAVISHALWQRRFGGVPGVVGQQVMLSGVAREIVGVMPARRVWPANVAIFIPMNAANFGPDVRERRDNMIFNALARLPDGADAQAVRSRMTAMSADIAERFPKERAGWTMTILPLRDYIVSPETSRALYVLLGAVVAVLLIACANVANLTLVRGASRARELAVRMALGASRRRIVQQLLVEAAVLTAAGCALGVAVAYGTLQVLISMAASDTPFLDNVGLNGRVLAATLLTGAVVALVTGVVPALSASSVRPSGAAREGTAGAGTSARAARVRSAFVVVQIAGTVVLVTASLLLMRSFERLVRVDAGVSLAKVVSGRIAIPGSRYGTPDRRRQFVDDLVARIEASGDVERAALTSFVPAGGGGFGLGRLFLPDGRPEPPAGADVGALWNTVTPGYFATMGIQLVEGRPFDQRDRSDTTPVMIVSRHFAERMAPGESMLGKRIRSWRDENVYREVVGVAEEVRYFGLAERERTPLVYVPYAQDVQFGMQIVARSREPRADRLAGSVRRALGEVDSGMAVAELRTVEASADRSIAAERYSTQLLSVLAGVALLLCGLGIYGVASYVFLMRRREMGIRLALGATRSNIYGLVFRHGFVLTAIGLVAGLGGAVLATRWMASLLFETTPADPLAWSGMVAVVIAATGLACALPARRAASADPTVALRAE